jgi:hydroxyethylthiazole kinase-like uncharacterized protein yjeF
MKVLTSAEMGEVDRRTMELGIPSLVLMENAGMRVVELLERKFAPLGDHRIVIFCGKGNNGGDGLVIARQLHTRFHPRSLHVVLASDPPEHIAMLEACGIAPVREISTEMRAATIVIDALLGTGLKGPAHGRMRDLIAEINDGFPHARVVAVDVPSGMDSDFGVAEGDFVHADYTVTFTAPKICHALEPNCNLCGEWTVGEIGSPSRLMDGVKLELLERASFAHLLAPRPKSAHKGIFGHALIIAGSRGKAGAAAMAGQAALRAGAGLVTVATPDDVLDAVASHGLEYMTEPLERLDLILHAMTALAIGPGMGTSREAERIVEHVFQDCAQPTVVDADALNILAKIGMRPSLGLRILTPHPGEMARLIGAPVTNRLRVAGDFARANQVILVLKGERTLIAFPDGRIVINPTGTPAMATGGSGDILTGMIGGFLAQFPNDPENAVCAAVFLHGRAGELGAAALGEKSFIAMDLLRYLPDAIR